MGSIVNWRRQIRNQVTEILNSLGGEPVEIAGRLRQHGVLGSPGDPRECAIAVYLGAVIAADPCVRRVNVATDHVVVVPDRGFRRSIVVTLPRPLRSFISGFDRHAYPELVRPKQSCAELAGDALQRKTV